MYSGCGYATSKNSGVDSVGELIQAGLAAAAASSCSISVVANTFILLHSRPRAHCTAAAAGFTIDRPKGSNAGGLLTRGRAAPTTSLKSGAAAECTVSVKGLEDPEGCT